METNLRSGRILPRLAIVITVIGVLALSGCGDSGSDSSGSGSTSTSDKSEKSGGATNTNALPDPCGLLSASDFSTATGYPFGTGVFNQGLSASDRRICDWKSDDPFATGQVLVTPASGFSQSRAGADSAIGPTVDQEIAGAQAAYSTSEGSIFAMRVGDLFLQVSYIPPGPGNVTEITKGLAEQAVANL